MPRLTATCSESSQSPPTRRRRRYASRSRTTFTVLRWGNIAGSRGSVIPLFRELLESGQRLPITDPGMTRFWITLPRAVELVMRCGLDPMLADLLVMPSDMRAYAVGDLATAIAGPDYPRQSIGIRPGEKRHEELLSRWEAADLRTHDDIMTWRHGQGSDGAIVLSSDQAPRMSVDDLRTALERL
jgi:FlaA1/EpsC-like NDP-sugar epimerase